MIKKMSLISFFTLSFTLFGAENTDLIEVPKGILSKASLESSKRKEAKKRVQFQGDTFSMYQSLNPEKSTAATRAYQKHNAQLKAAQSPKQGPRVQAANTNWDETGNLSLVSLTPEEESKERSLKLQAVSDLLEFEIEEIEAAEANLSDAETPEEKQKKIIDAQKTSLLMRALQKEEREFDDYMRVLFENHSDYFIAFVNYMMKMLVGINEDFSMVSADISFEHKLHELRITGLFDDQKLFRSLLEDFLENYEYSTRRAFHDPTLFPPQ
jgi:hypothetical protein